MTQWRYVLAGAHHHYHLTYHRTPYYCSWKRSAERSFSHVMSQSQPPHQRWSWGSGSPFQRMGCFIQLGNSNSTSTSFKSQHMTFNLCTCGPSSSQYDQENFFMARHTISRESDARDAQVKFCRGLPIKYPRKFSTWRLEPWRPGPCRSFHQR